MHYRGPRVGPSDRHREQQNDLAASLRFAGRKGGLRAIRALRRDLSTLARFARASWLYWTCVFPLVCRQVRGWRADAEAIPDPVLRKIALDALAKRGNLEGAAAYATFAPSPHRAAAVKAAVAFQAAYNFLDLLVEQRCADPVRNGASLHEALSVALTPGAAHGDYYAYCGCSEDGGYLARLADACRDALVCLPSVELIWEATRRTARRVIVFQSLNLGEDNGDHLMFAQWAAAATPEGSGLRWWETGASAGSSLCVHVLIAAAARRDLTATAVSALEQAYFPWIGALHSLLDNLIDIAEDARTGQRNLIACYASVDETAERMAALAAKAQEVAGDLEDGLSHTLVVAAMTGMYLSVSEAFEPAILPVRERILDALGLLARLTLLVFAARHGAESVNARVRRGGRDGAQQRGRERGRIVSGAGSPCGDVKVHWGSDPVQGGNDPVQGGNDPSARSELVRAAR